MASLKFISLFCITAAATIAPAIYYKSRNFEFGASEITQKRIERMGHFPDRIGDWTLIDQLNLESSARDQLTPLATINRLYSNGDQIANVFVLFGPTGPTAVHTPDICFNARDYESSGLRRQIAIGSENTLWQIDFKSRGVDAHSLRSWYGWTTDGNWHAANDPRYEYANNNTLFKLQVAIRYPNEAAMNADTASNEFLQRLIRQIQSTVF